MDNQVIFGGQINIQNHMRIVHVCIFHFKKKHVGYKNPAAPASHHLSFSFVTEGSRVHASPASLHCGPIEIANFHIISHFSDQRRLRRVCALSQTRLSFKISILFLISAISEGSDESVHCQKFDLALTFQK